MVREARAKPDRAAGRGSARAPRPAARRAAAVAETSLALMRRLGFRRIGELMAQPRAPLRGPLRARAAAAPRPGAGARARAARPCRAAARLSRARRLPRADPQPRSTCSRPPRGCCERWPRTRRAMRVGARVLRLLLFRMDGEVQSLDIGLAAPSRDAAHIARLIAPAPRSPGRRARGRLRLRGGGRARAGRRALGGAPGHARRWTRRLPRPRRSAQLDRPPAAALGAGAVCRLSAASRATSPSAPCASALVPPLLAGEGRGGGAASAGSRRPHPNPLPMPGEACGDGRRSPPRPLLLLPRPEAAEVVALIPEGPPRQFRWRGVLHQVAEAQGPERIAPEWWRRTRRARRATTTSSRTRRPPLLALPRRPLRPRRRHPALVRARGVRMSGRRMHPGVQPSRSAGMTS